MAQQRGRFTSSKSKQRWVTERAYASFVQHRQKLLECAQTAEKLWQHAERLGAKHAATLRLRGTELTPEENEAITCFFCGLDSVQRSAIKAYEDGNLVLAVTISDALERSGKADFRLPSVCMVS